MVKRSIKYLSVVMITIFIVIGLFMLFIQTPWFADFTKKQAIKYINQEINAHLSIDQITGNWFSQLEIKNIKLKQNVDSLPIAHIASIELKYDVWSLLKRKIAVQSVHINHPEIWLKQDKNGKWSINEIVPAKQDTLELTSGRFLYDLVIDTICLTDGNIYTQSQIEVIPDSLKNLNLNASFFYTEKIVRSDLRQFELNTVSPDVSVRNIKARFQKNVQRISLDSLFIQANKTFIEGSTNYESLNNLNGQLNASPLSNQLVNVFMSSIELPHSPTINMDFTSREDTTNLNIKLTVANEQILIDLNLLHLDKYSGKQINNIPFSTHILFTQVQPENWWKISPTQSSINGQFSLSGSDLLNINEWQNINGELSNSSYRNHIFNTLTFNASQSNDTLLAQVNLRSGLGELNGNLELQHLYSNPEYKALITIDTLLLKDLLTPDAGYINAQIAMHGNDFKKDNLNLQCDLLITDSYTYGIPIDSAHLSAQLNHNVINWFNSDIALPGANFHSKGQYQLETKQLSAITSYALNSLDFLSGYQLPVVEFNQVQGNITIAGTPDRLKSDGSIKMNQFNGFSLTGEQIISDFEASYLNGQIQADANIKMFLLQNDQFTIDSIKSHFSYNKDLLNAQAMAYMDSITTHLVSEVTLKDTIDITIPFLDVNTPFANYYIADSLNSIRLHRTEINIKNLSIKDKLSPLFKIDVNGTISDRNAEDLELNVTQLNLKTLNDFNLIEDHVNGVFSSQIKLTGQPQSPKLQSSFSISPGSFGNIQTPHLEGHVKIEDDTLASDIYIPGHKNKLSLSYATPTEFRFDSLGFVFEPGNTFESLLTVDSLNIANPTNRMANIQADGQLFANIKAQGTYNQPMFFGSVQLKDGMYKFDEMGIDIQNANIALKLDSNQISIDTFLIKRDKGYFTMSGQASFDSSIVSSNIHSSTLQADAQNFYIIKHRNYSALIDANSFLKTINDSTRFGGKITVMRSDFYLPALTGKEDNDQINEIPLLVEAITPIDTTHNNEKTVAKKIKENSNPEFIKNLQGRLILEIPRNTWLRSKEMKIEIWGDLEIEKSNEYFELYGDVGINRGYYILYGKKLVIDEGQLTFQGGEQIDPILDFKATYTYRGPDKEKRKLMLQVSDKLSEPSISFTLDGVSIPEADAISILILGKTMDELSFAGQNGIAGALGTEMIAKAVTNQLSKTLGTRFNLDMIEVTATENWQSAAFVVGKYVTNDLFVVYQRGFGEAEGDEITPEMIILEYELNRILFFRLQSGSSKDSGFDVILKFESKKD